MTSADSGDGPDSADSRAPDDSGLPWIQVSDALDPEQDPVAFLHDTQEESGDEDAVHDSFTIDTREAHEVGVQLDQVDDGEPPLD
ncbi:MAG: hypothetical protein WCD35_08920 [Mycobacteriales bacterium]